MDKITNKSQLKKPLFDKLIDYTLKRDIIPFDVPGHKMGKGIQSEFKELVGTDIFKLDINSSKEMDMLNSPKGVIKEAEQLAADLYNADNGYFLVNGSTSGVQNMILSTITPNDKIIMPRNVHKSAINALILSGGVPIFMKPHIDNNYGLAMGIPFEEAKMVIDNNLDAKAILLVNPNYFGFTQDIEKIISYAHSKNITALVDEAWGSHFPFSSSFPKSAMNANADMSTISMHKTGGSLTQSSILFTNNKRIDKDIVRSSINLMQSSSANYLLMASLDIARYNWAKDYKEITDNLVRLSNYTRDSLNNIDNIRCLGVEILNNDSIFEQDITKIVVDTRSLGLSGFEVYDIFKENYNIQLELAETNVVLAVISIGDTNQSVDLLINAFKDLSNKSINNKLVNTDINLIDFPKLCYSPREAYYKEQETILLTNSENRIAGESIMFYPPGIPLLIPGEIITKEVIDYYLFLVEKGAITLGTTSDIKIDVLK